MNLFESKPILNVLKPVNVGDNIKPNLEEQLKIAIKALEEINNDFELCIKNDNNPFPVSWFGSAMFSAKLAGEALDKINGIDPENIDEDEYIEE